MKLVDALDVRGNAVVFWLKQGWSDTRKYSAVQFGMFRDIPDPHRVPNSYFIDYVAERVGRSKKRGAQYALFVHLLDSIIVNYVALKVDDVAEAYRRQIAGWPARARNTKTPTLYFEDSRRHPDANATSAVTEFEISLESIAGVPLEQSIPTGFAAKKITAEIERRLKQQQFRELVGNRCGWRCVVSGNAIPEVLEAAHLPGRHWRQNNSASDGIILRADIHRLLDRNLASIEGGRFMIAEAARAGEYSAFHGKEISEFCDS